MIKIIVIKKIGNPYKIIAIIITIITTIIVMMMIIIVLIIRIIEMIMIRINTKISVITTYLLGPVIDRENATQ